MKYIRQLLNHFVNQIEQPEPLRKQMQKMLKHIGDGYDWSQNKTVWDFINWLSENRMLKKLVFVPIIMPSFLHGAWLTSNSKEYIFYDCRALPGHREHTILHEICHALLNHKTKYITEEEGDFFAQQPPDCPIVSQFLLQAARHRSGLKISDKQDEQAEMLAKLIQQKIITTHVSSDSLLHESYLEIITTV